MVIRDFMNIESRRIERINQEYVKKDEISTRHFNAFLGGFFIYGLIFDACLCNVMRAKTTIHSSIILVLLYIMCLYVGKELSSKTHKVAYSFIGYNVAAVPFGVVCTALTSAFFGIDNSVIVKVLMITAGVTACMLIAGIVIPDSFFYTARTILVVLSGMAITAMAVHLLGVELAGPAWIPVFVFSFYIAYHYHRAQMFQKTMINAVDCALDTYLYLIYLFIFPIHIWTVFAHNKSFRRS